MLISLNWLRDYVDLPADLDVPALAERFTMVCAEVEGVQRIAVGAAGLIAARVLALQDLAGTRNLKLARLDLGHGRTASTVTAAPQIRVNDTVVFAPPGARTDTTGVVQAGHAAGHPSEGLILPGEALGLAASAGEAVFCPPTMQPGEAVSSELLDDWVIEIDNKSITHRPDLWGHYGIAREVAAMLRLPLQPYPVVPRSELDRADLPVLPIEIDDPQRCPRYTGLVITGVGAQPGPLWMQTRLGHVGLRPIDCLVDLTNYIMADLGQPMHAFDGDRVDHIEVALAEPGSTFTTLDNVARSLPAGALMIMSRRRPVALAGIMGGLETEVTSGTKRLLLESANFEPAGIRRCASALGLRTEASARFEKSLDPAHTVLAIQRFVHLARAEFPQMALAGRLSDCYPRPAVPMRVEVEPVFVNRFLGRSISVEEITAILSRLGFGVEHQAGKLLVDVPSFRATKDISIEADIIEEISRCVGYDNIPPALPEATVRCFEPNAQHRLERETLRTFCPGLGYCEIYLYIWHDESWLRRLGVDLPATAELRNPAAAGQSHLRDTLLPGLLQCADLNRLHFDRFKLCELGSVFPPPAESAAQERRIGLLVARRGKNIEDQLLSELKGDIESWSWQVLRAPAGFTVAGPQPAAPWVHEHKTASIIVQKRAVGLVSVVPLPLRRAIDEHLGSWAMAWAELSLDPLAGAAEALVRLRRVPDHPEVELDFSVLVPSAMRFGAVEEHLRRFAHPLLRRVSYVGAYVGAAVPEGRRSLTFRARVGAGDRTLVDEDLGGFRRSFEQHVRDCGFELRAG